MQQKKVPMRMCNGCGEMKPKKELVRIVRAPDGSVSLDPKGKAPGRGAYLCHSAECLKKAVKSGRIGRALGVAVPKEIYESMQKELLENAE